MEQKKSTGRNANSAHRYITALATISVDDRLWIFQNLCLYFNFIMLRLCYHSGWLKRGQNWWRYVLIFCKQILNKGKVPPSRLPSFKYFYSVMYTEGKYLWYFENNHLCSSCFISNIMGTLLFQCGSKWNIINLRWHNSIFFIIINSCNILGLYVLY